MQQQDNKAVVNRVGLLIRSTPMRIRDVQASRPDWNSRQHFGYGFITLALASTSWLWLQPQDQMDLSWRQLWPSHLKPQGRISRVRVTCRTPCAGMLSAWPKMPSWQPQSSQRTVISMLNNKSAHRFNVHNWPLNHIQAHTQSFNTAQTDIHLISSHLTSFHVTSFYLTIPVLHKLCLLHYQQP